MGFRRSGSDGQLAMLHVALVPSGPPDETGHGCADAHAIVRRVVLRPAAGAAPVEGLDLRPRQVDVDYASGLLVEDQDQDPLTLLNPLCATEGSALYQVGLHSPGLL